MLGFYFFAFLKRVLISFSDSPAYFDIQSNKFAEKNVLVVSVSQALTR